MPIELTPSEAATSLRDGIINPIKNQQLYVHTKSQKRYRVIVADALNEADLMAVVVYKSEETGIVFVRPQAEFVKRFEVPKDLPTVQDVVGIYSETDAHNGSGAAAAVVAKVREGA